MKFKSRITFDYDGNIANAKSVLSVLGACIKSGDEITLMCDGEDEAEALSYLTEFIAQKLGE
jgi:phosphocarrier protein